MHAYTRLPEQACRACTPVSAPNRDLLDAGVRAEPLLRMQAAARPGAPPDLADKEARQHAGDGDDEDDEPVDGCGRQHLNEQVVDLLAQRYGQRAIGHQVQEPYDCSQARRDRRLCMAVVAKHRLRQLACMQMCTWWTLLRKDGVLACVSLRNHPQLACKRACESSRDT